MQDIKNILVVVVMLLWSLGAVACDGCGVSLGGANGSLLNINNRSFISLFSNQATFSSNQNSGHNISDNFISTRLDLRYAFNDNWSLVSGIAHFNKSRTENEKDLSLNGFGDLGLGINYSITESLNDSYNLYSEFGLQMALPTSRYDTRLHDKDLPQNFNLGTGSLSFGFNSTIALKKTDSGLILTGSYMHNAKSENSYRIGGTFVLRSSVYRTISLSEKVTGIINIGLQFENQVKDHYANGNEVNSSGSRALYLPIAIGFSVDKFTLQADINIPLTQNYINNELIAHSRIGVQAIYFLN